MQNSEVSVKYLTAFSRISTPGTQKKADIQ